MSVVNNAEVRELLKATKSEYGFCLSLGHMSYAMSMLFNGSIVDRWGGKKAMILGACGTAAVNGFSAILFSVRGHTILSLTGCNIVNMFFQPFGSLCIVKINSAWYLQTIPCFAELICRFDFRYDNKERGVFSGVFGVMIGCGTFYCEAVSLVED